MRVFISWSGSRSKALALQLHEWLKTVVQLSDPWMSERDIGAGQRWNEEVSSRLRDTHFGIICLTPGNLNAPWLLFEAGALAKALDSARVVPMLLGIKKTDLGFPLAQFQAEDADREGFWRLVSALNSSLGEKKLSEVHLNKIFTGLWPTLESVLNSLPREANTDVEQTRRGDRELLEEALEGVRAVRRVIAPNATDQSSARMESMTWEDFYIRGVNLANSRGGDEKNLAALRAYNEAIALAPGELDRGNRSRLHAYRGAVLKRLARLDEAEHDLLLAQKWAAEPREIEDADYNMACVMAMGGRADEAITLVRKLISMNRRWANILRGSPYFENLAGNKSFAALIAPTPRSNNRKP